MREILFRGKRVGFNEWIEGYYFQRKNNECVEGFVAAQMSECAAEFKPVYPETVGQYTGLTDKNGKKIFEGDIVRFSTPYCSYTAPIVYQNGVWCADNKREASFTLYSIMKLTPEVIGNIHDNPELLEVN